MFGHPDPAGAFKAMKTSRQNLQSRPGFRAALGNDGTLELMIYGDIVDQTTLSMMEGYGYPTDGFVSALAVKKQIDSARNFKRIALRINSPGGDAFEGTAIYNLIRSQRKPVDVFVDGVAASSASIVAMAGDTITMGVNSMMMIHNAWCGCMGDATEMRKTADILDKVSGSIRETYVHRTGKSDRAVKALMDAETWMSADDCLREGFATSIAERDEDQAALAQARGFRSLDRFAKTPRTLREPSNNLSLYKAKEKMLLRNTAATGNRRG